MNEEKSKYKFINPYHFIPLGNSCKRQTLSEKDKVLTGKITVEIKTKTPIFIPNISSDRLEYCNDAKNKEENKLEHHCYEFFSYHQYQQNDDKTVPYEPVIPGSEIRGMFRSIYEAVTDSCMSAIELDKPLYKRTNDYYKCGLLVKTDECIKLHEISNGNIAKYDYLRNHGEKFDDGDKVIYVSKKGKKGQNFVSKIRKFDDVKLTKEEKIGYILKGEKGPELTNARKMKHYAKVLSEDKNLERDKKIKLEKNTIQSFEHILDTYRDERINKKLNTSKHSGYKKYRKAWDELKEGKRKCLPVYYSVVNLCKQGDNKDKKENIYLSPACITKESYFNDMKSLLSVDSNPEHSFAPCQKKNNLCDACDLFGMVGEESLASKIRFADARLVDNTNFKKCLDEEITVLEELAQPKISAVEFYLQRPCNGEADFWTYDYYTKDGEKYKYDRDEPVKIMGRKFYWHFDFRKKNAEKIERVPLKTKRNKSVRLLKENQVFTEDIYFENITESQLKQLIYLLNISKKKDDRGHYHGYKVGAGKPLGLGSISMKILNVYTREFDIQSENLYCEKSYTDLDVSYEDAKFSEKIKTVFQKVTDFEYVFGNFVSYPLTEQQYEKVFERGKTLEEGFKWFKENKGGKIEERSKVKIKDNLISLNQEKTIDDINLNCWKEPEEARGNKTRNKNKSKNQKRR